MTQLLNRFAWCVSIALGCCIAFGLSGSNEAMFIIGLFFGVIIKALFFSKNYITERLQHFKKALTQNESGDTVVTPNIPNEFENIRPEEAYPSNPSHIVDQSENIPLIDEDDEYEQERTYSNQDQNQRQENAITAFFSENILAKIGGILVFLGVIFLLTLVWNVIPGILKIALGFAIAASTYFTGVKLNQKGLIQEGRILLGLAVLINYAVILSGRYVIGDTHLDTTPLFTAGISFVLLILNTILAVFTALCYKSTPLLIFSFAFAYLNPYLIGMQDPTPYIQVGYSIILSLGALYLSVTKGNAWLLILVFTLGNLLIFGAQNLSENSEIGYVVKFVSMIGITLMSLMAAIKMEKETQKFVELLFAGSFFLVGLFGLLNSPSDIQILGYLLTIGASFIFMIVSYFHMHTWPFLYSIGTIGGALVLSTSLVWSQEAFITYSIFTLILYFILNIYGALKLKINDDNALKNLVIGSVSGILFIVFETYRYATINDQSTELLGVFYLILGLIYFGIAHALSHKIGWKSLKENILQQNVVYSFLGIGISLVSLAVALIFSEYDYVIALFWLFESTVLLYFFKRIGDIKIYMTGLVLMLLGILAFWSKLPLPTRGEYLYLITSGLICLSLVLNIIFTSTKENTFVTSVYRDLHDYLHIIALILVLVFVSRIFDIQYNLIILGVIMSGAGYIYKKYGSIILQSIFVIVMFLGFFLHIMNAFEMLHATTFNHLLQYTTSFTLIGAVYTFIKTPKTDIHRSPLISISSIYLFIITSLYIYQIFPNVFAVTIYWGALAFLLISNGIGKDIIALRTTGLYLIMLMCLKIFFIDIPYSIDETIIKVVAFIAVGIMLIVISSMYSKKYGNKLKGEYQLSNLLGEIKTEKTINQKISDIHIGDISCVTFQPTGGTTFSTKAQNLLKIVVMIMGDETEKSFEANELLESYNYIVKNYTSDLNQRDLTRIKSVVFDFVKTGGNVIIKK